jgi:hypothetical protein
MVLPVEWALRCVFVVVFSPASPSGSSFENSSRIVVRSESTVETRSSEGVEGIVNVDGVAGDEGIGDAENIEETLCRELDTVRDRSRELALESAS